MGNSNSSDSGRYDRESLMESGIKIFDDKNRSFAF